MDQAQRLREMVMEKAEILAEAEDSSEIKKPRIITVTSGKGGVGKSNFVVNLAIVLQKLGNKVLIFDADIGMGNDDVLMGSFPQYNVFDIILNDKTIDEVIVQGPYGVKLLAGGSGLAKVDDLTEVQRNRLISQLALLKDLDFIIMDTGAGINRSVLGFVSCCEELIVITTPEPTSLTDVYSLLKAVSHFKLKSKARVVINRVQDEKEGQLTYKKLNKAVTAFLKINLEYSGIVYEDKKLIQAVKLQQPFVIEYPHCEASKSIGKIAENILGNPYKTENAGIKGLFSRIFNNFA
jgi:flagellar biosynthesis protein FlhG